MQRHKLNTRVVIAASNLLYQSGIQSLIKHIGVQPEYIILKSIQNNELTAHTNAEYLILDQKLLTKPRNRHFKQIISQFKGEILVIGSDKTSPEFHSHILLPMDSKNTIVEKIQNFFTLQNIKDKTENEWILSTREIDVLQKVAKGLSNKEISEQLFISINTVITHRKNITEKLGIKTISGLTVYALMNNLINPEEITA